jgi:hypothetical protein
MRVRRFRAARAARAGASPGQLPDSAVNCETLPVPSAAQAAEKAGTTERDGN